MRELLTSAQMRAIEQAAIGSGAVTGLELMERAGRGVVEAVFEEWPELAQAPHRAVVLCGPGNNGGDGFVVARLLKEWGWEVEVFLYGEPDRLPQDARTNYERWAVCEPVLPWNDNLIEDRLDDFIEGQPDSFAHDLVVDALFGTGLTRPMPDDTERMWHGFVPNVLGIDPDRRPKYVAVDAPSGLDTDTGASLGAAPVDLTVSFHRPKLGHYLLADGHYGGGPGLSGKLVVKDIGLEGAARLATAGPGPAVPLDEIVGLMERHGSILGRCGYSGILGKYEDAHKYTHGHALVLSGPKARSGAARLAARGALRVGAGLVTVGAPKSALDECAAQLTAIMLRRCDGGADLEDLLEDARLNALCLGPGLGLGGETRDLVKHALQSGRPCVLDADALTAFAERPEELFEMLHPDCVLTPHGGEFARLFPDIAERLKVPATSGPALSKVDAARAAAARAGCVVLFKGADTVIANPSGKCVLNAALYERAAPWLATAGAGDVLTGFIAGLLARGVAPMGAAETAAWLHVECALKFGPGLIAEDLPEILPEVFRDLGL
ncbi:MAG: NAD(P)H-hydrate dehydratase [Paracoccaceae bacterium]